MNYHRKCIHHFLVKQYVKLNQFGSLISVNIDFPIRVFSTRFEKNRVLRKLNFEVQVSPFIDFAFVNNKATGTSFSVKDGFYAGGMEVIVFPES